MFLDSQDQKKRQIINLQESNSKSQAANSCLHDPASDNGAGLVDSTLCHAQLAARVISFLKRRCLLPNGLMSRTYPPSSILIFDHFDDVVPFFLHYQEEEFLIEQVHILEKRGFSIQDICQTNGIVLTRNVDEWIGGLATLYLRTHDPKVKKMLNDSTKFIENNLMVNDRLLGGYNITRKKPILCSESWSSGLLETFIENARLFPHLASKALKILEMWINEPYFLEHGLFRFRTSHSKMKGLSELFIPDALDLKWSYTIPCSFSFFDTNKTQIKDLMKFWLTSGKYSQIMKSNSTVAFTLMEAYKFTNDTSFKLSLKRWIESVTEKMLHRGWICDEFFPGHNIKRNPLLSSSSIFIDLITDYEFFIEKNPSFINEANLLADSLISQTNRQGIIPLQIDTNTCHLDTNVDFSISLRKLAIVNGDVQRFNYLKSRSSEIIRNVISLHWENTLGCAYTFSNHQGEVWSIDAKYNALLLKGIIAADAKEEDIFGSLHSLLKDR